MLDRATDQSANSLRCTVPMIDGNARDHVGSMSDAGETDMVHAGACQGEANPNTDGQGQAANPHSVLRHIQHFVAAGITSRRLFDDRD
jgi:hypothetical protein